jgi:hypothetical protein
VSPDVSEARVDPHTVDTQGTTEVFPYASRKCGQNILERPA